MKLEHEKDFMFGEFTRVTRAAFLDHLEEVAKEGKYKDLNKRIRWDMFWAIPTANRNAFLERNKGINDNHIDTLLKYTLKRYLLHRNIVVNLESLVEMFNK